MVIAILGVVFVVISVILFCCVRAGAVADERIHAMFEEETDNAHPF